MLQRTYGAHASGSEFVQHGGRARILLALWSRLVRDPDERSIEAWQEATRVLRVRTSRLRDESRNPSLPGCRYGRNARNLTTELRLEAQAATGLASEKRAAR